MEKENLMKIQKAIITLKAEKSCAEHEISIGRGNQHITDFIEAINIAEECLKKEIPKTPIFHEERHEQHSYIKDENGEIDEFAFEMGYCNGPICEICGYSFCKHCEPNGYDDKECVVSYHTCPTCGAEVISAGKRCNCGQVLCWEEKEHE